MRDLGVKLREAATGSAWNVNAQAAAAFAEKIAAADPSLAAEAAQFLTREVRTAPTLVKYAQPNDYEIQSQRRAGAGGSGDSEGPAHCSGALGRPGRAHRDRWKSSWPRRCSTRPATTPTARFAILSPGFQARGFRRSSSWVCATAASTTKHCAPSMPEPLCASTSSWTSAASATCTAIAAARRSSSSFTAIHGYETPNSGDLAGDADVLGEAGILAEYQAAIEAAHEASAQIAAGAAPEAAQSALYLLPLATRIRSLFKMDFAEAQYISELRSGPAGHFSYRRVAWEMYLAVERQHPSLAAYIRVTDFTKPIDLLQR